VWVGGGRVCLCGREKRGLGLGRKRFSSFLLEHLAPVFPHKKAIYHGSLCQYHDMTVGVHARV